MSTPRDGEENPKIIAEILTPEVIKKLLNIANTSIQKLITVVKEEQNYEIGQKLLQEAQEQLKQLEIISSEPLQFPEIEEVKKFIDQARESIKETKVALKELRFAQEMLRFSAAVKEDTEHYYRKIIKNEFKNLPEKIIPEVTGLISSDTSLLMEVGYIFYSMARGHTANHDTVMQKGMLAQQMAIVGKKATWIAGGEKEEITHLITRADIRKTVAKVKEIGEVALHPILEHVKLSGAAQKIIEHVTLGIHTAGIAGSVLGLGISVYETYKAVKEKKEIDELKKEILSSPQFVETKSLAQQVANNLKNTIAALGHEHPLRIAFATSQNYDFLFHTGGAEDREITRGDAKKIIYDNHMDINALGLENLAILLGKLDPLKAEDQSHINLIKVAMEKGFTKIDAIENGKYSMEVRQGISGIIAQSAMQRATRKITTAQTKQTILAVIKGLTIALAVAGLVAACVGTAGIALPVAVSVALIVLGVSLAIGAKLADSKVAKEGAINAAAFCLEAGIAAAGASINPEKAQHEEQEVEQRHEEAKSIIQARHAEVTHGNLFGFMYHEPSTSPHAPAAAAAADSDDHTESPQNGPRV